MLNREQCHDFASYFAADAEYFNDEASFGTELWTKVKPKEVHRRTDFIVVKTFRADTDGKPITTGLPYELVLADESMDMWAIGVSTVGPLCGDVERICSLPPCRHTTWSLPVRVHTHRDGAQLDGLDA